MTAQLEERREATAWTALAGKRIVLVEDEGLTQLQLQRILSRAGLKIAASAMNGKEGVEAVLREQPDLVLMDIRMPIMDGLEATGRILPVYRTCIVMLTAFDDQQYRQKARAAGACGYVTKPVMAENLLPQLAAAYAAFNTGTSGNVMDTQAPPSGLRP